MSLFLEFLHKFIKYNNAFKAKIHKYADLFGIVLFIKITTFKSYIYVSGGGGGKTGIPNELVHVKKLSSSIIGLLVPTQQKDYRLELPCMRT